MDRKETPRTEHNNGFEMSDKRRIRSDKVEAHYDYVLTKLIGMVLQSADQNGMLNRIDEQDFVLMKNLISSGKIEDEHSRDLTNSTNFLCVACSEEEKRKKKNKAGEFNIYCGVVSHKVKFFELSTVEEFFKKRESYLPRDSYYVEHLRREQLSKYTGNNRTPDKRTLLGRSGIYLVKSNQVNLGKHEYMVIFWDDSPINYELKKSSSGVTPTQKAGVIAVADWKENRHLKIYPMEHGGANAKIKAFGEVFRMPTRLEKNPPVFTKSVKLNFTFDAVGERLFSEFESLKLLKD